MKWNEKKTSITDSKGRKKRKKEEKRRIIVWTSEKEKERVSYKHTLFIAKNLIR